MRILLVVPQIVEDVWQHISILEPLGLESIAAHCYDHEIKIIDLRIETNLRHEIVSFQPDIIGFHSHSTEVARILAHAETVKKVSPEIFTMVGGHHATMLPNEFNSAYLDLIVIGEGEITFRKIVECIEKGQDFRDLEGIAYRDEHGILRVNKKKPLISNLDDVQIPKRDLVQKYLKYYFYLEEKPIALVSTSRGCPYQCIFCSVWKFNDGEYRCMSPERVIRELETIAIKNIYFVDDNFLHDVKRAEKLYEAIKYSGINKKYRLVTRSDVIAENPALIEKWKEIGLNNAQIAFEYIQNKRLNDIKKNNCINDSETATEILRKNGIKITANFIINPDFEESDFDELNEYIEKMEIDYPLLSILTPLPGTTLYKKVFQELITHNYGLYNFLHAVTPTKLPREQFYRRFAQIQKNAWLLTMKRGRSLVDNIDSKTGGEVILALKKLSDYKYYLSAEKDK
ncbi:MAG: B12-binding domain-containing radical SAM protein [Promethearchaeota archaeon]|jgi:radical SAM superfamily enzyme YgiQ (UPF0313 family)